MIVYGLNPVLEALRAGRVRKLRVGPRSDRRVEDAIALARKAGVHDRAHRRAVARSGRPRRGASGAGRGGRCAAGLLRSRSSSPRRHRRRRCSWSSTGSRIRTTSARFCEASMRRVGTASCGRRGTPPRSTASWPKRRRARWRRVRIATVVNIARALDELKEAGVWTVGLAADATESYDEIDLTLPTAIVLGAEGSGLRRLVRERCDRLAAMPMRGHVESLNVSVAAGVMLFEAARQRRRKGSV